MKGTIKYSVNLTKKLRILERIGKTESNIRCNTIKTLMRNIEARMIIVTIDGFIPNFVTKSLSKNTRRT
jgi:hypothetical protein